jgi:hypothetical protein
MTDRRTDQISVMRNGVQLKHRRIEEEKIYRCEKGHPKGAHTHHMYD